MTLNAYADRADYTDIDAACAYVHAYFARCEDARDVTLTDVTEVDDGHDEPYVRVTGHVTWDRAHEPEQFVFACWRLEDGVMYGEW